MVKLDSAERVVVGASDVARTVAYLTVFGFAPGEAWTVPASAAEALYGIAGGTREHRLTVPGSDRGAIHVVATPHPAAAPGLYDAGGHAIDLYTRDIERSVVLAREAGADVGPIGTYHAGERAIREAKALGPDGLPLVFIELAGRRPSILDRNPERLHSEVHSIVWVVGALDDALSFWEQAGLRVLADLTLQDPAITSFMRLPDPDVTLRLALLCDAEARPARLELLQFATPTGPPMVAPGPLRAGGLRPAFVVDDLARAVATLAGARFGPMVEAHGRMAAAGVAPGEVAFLLEASGDRACAR